MERIGSAVDRLIRRLKDKKEDDPQENLKKFLTKKELKHIKLCNVKQGVATFNVDSSVWLYALSLKKQQLTDGLGLKDIRLRIGEVS
ncbi:MAG: hypothetical protein PHU91_00505 [Candidatus Omnitrophica bacterium]|nr:hypothetical protein [Candidatus Omnitrophota bacterium]MDD5236142.1 hypothetical protein [Candidatus Omnitrophota bacterium]MDD5611399.1 hypothetical protein [Candidatus Omnitrophota bacterium]